MTGRFSMRKYRYRLKTYSTVVLSPRDHQGFYLEAGDFHIEDIQSYPDLYTEKVNIIYPFYQYGIYDRYQPHRAEYYIPGSSIKGSLALQNTEHKSIRLQVDDIRITRENLQLCHLYKVQHHTDGAEDNESPNKAEIDMFFPNVAVEMLKAKAECSGEMYSDLELESVHDIFKRAHGETVSKLDKLINRIKCVEAQLKKEADRNIMQQIINKIYHVQNLNDDGYLLILGGYKGLILSTPWDIGNTKSAIYIDMKNHLPHGLVKVTLE